MQTNNPVDEEKCGLNLPDFIVFDLDPYIYSGKEKKGQKNQNIMSKRFKQQLMLHMI